MGKGNRTRNDRYDDVYSMSGGSSVAVKKNKNGAKKDYTSVLMIAVIAVLVISALALFIFSDSGIMERNTVYVSSENFEVTGTMLPYYENLAYSRTFENYYYTYYYYMYQNDANQALNAAQQLMSQYTLADFFDSAITTSKELVALAEEATAKGVKLDAEDLKTIDETLAEYSAGSFGAGVKKKDIRKALELQTLAAKYADQVGKEIEDGLTDADILAYVEQNKADYYSADYYAYEFLLKAEDYAEDAVGYTAAEKLVDSYAEKLAKATDLDSFKKVIIEYEIEKSFDYLIENNKGALATPDKETAEAAKQKIIENTYNVVVKGETAAESFTDNASYGAMFRTMAESLVNTCKSAVAEVEQSVGYNDLSEDEMIKWISGNDIKVGDSKIVDGSDEEEYVKNVYVVAEAMHLDVAETKDVAHILIKAAESADEATKAAAKEKADKVLAEFLAGEQTLEAFEKLAETYNEDSGCVYRGTTEGKMVKNFNDWIFDEARKSGDTDVVETEYGYHVMYFIDDGEAPYYAAAKESYTNDKYTLLIEELTEKHVKLNDKAIAKNTTVTTTEAE